jgi:cytoplasmic iron level regulating protein YaaA (DUF328/UPF0246 family)
MDYDKLKKLWNCSDAIARRSFEQLHTSDLRRNLTPAILSYVGIQYQYMAPGVFTQDEFEYIQTHLRILSGFYGVLRPFDGVVPYRLEMQARLAVGGAKDLYGYWGGDIAAKLLSESDCVVDLASKEYSLCLTRHSGQARVVSCVFGEEAGGKVVEKGTLCKMARGEMVRFLAEIGAENPEAMRDFARLGYEFSSEHSSIDRYVFINTGKGRGE